MPDDRFVVNVADVQEDFLVLSGATTSVPSEAYADWSREFTPTQLNWPPGWFRSGQRRRELVVAQLLGRRAV